MHKVVYILLIAIIVFLCSNGCRSTRVDPAVLEYQKQIDELTAELQRRDTAIRDGIFEINAVASRCRDMDGEISTIIELLDEYQRTVERMLRDYQQARREDKAQAESVECVDNIHYN